MTNPVIEKKKPGRPKGSTGTRTLTREHQARLQAARELKAKKKKIEKLEVKLSQERGKFKNKKEALTSPVLTETTKENLPTKVKEFIEENTESIVLKPNAEASEADIISHCRDKIAGYKVPKSIDFTDVLPRNPSGKLLKRELRQPYWEGKTRQIN